MQMIYTDTTLLLNYVCVGLRWRGGLCRGRGPVTAHSLPCDAAQLSCVCADPLPRAWKQLPVDCVLLLGGVAGATEGL